ncbi:helix-turn-helix domain-containing protein [Glycomyces sp. A-F 0318]|uniref:helix-turn-helix domain-containing protein n=1 Tax=Glycomyces amatae TaxID=2881355 RepID=UPI001E31386A|nr:helix-turn-helix domain-containing protein [Glycomyces amatae]MCD0445627.1 helix-turn-helix domain-containing protein [Glycomyces amatae]
MEDFGARVRAARTTLGWSQGELARRAGVGQQAVSGWERGRTPDGEMLERVAVLLGLESVAARTPESELGLPRVTRLPFENLDEYQFESFSADLIAELYPRAAVNRFGGRGETQHGIDVRVVTDSGERIGVQCKHMRKFHPASFDKALSELDRDGAGIDRCLLFLSSSATVRVQQRAASFPDWQIWDGDVLARKVHGLPKEAALRIVDRYFPGLREPFLGISKPSPWEQPADAFDRFTQGDRFSHRWTLVGRSSELREITEFMVNDGELGQLGMIVGAAGVGKSRLLKALSENLSNDPTFTIRVAPREPVRPEDFALLPASGRLVLIVEDAHEHGAGLRPLLTGVLGEHPDAKVVLATRRYALPEIRTVLRKLGVDDATVPTWELSELSQTEATALATEALGGGHQPIAARLAQAVRDCPLLLVAGAVQIREGRLSTHSLGSDNEIRRLVVDAFLRSATAGRVNEDPTVIEVLRAISLLQPFRENVPTFQQAIAALTRQRFHTLTPHLKALEDDGVLLRRGTALRIVPDLLGDIILSDAAILHSAVASTGFLEEAYTAVGHGEPLLNALANASRVEWQWKIDEPRAPSLIDGLWESLESTFKSAEASVQAELLPMLRRIAPFQPERVFRLLYWLHTSQPSGAPRLELAPVLEAVTYGNANIDDVCDLLWELGRDDKRPLNSAPEHPLRALTNLASYKLDKPLAHQDAVISAVQRWIAADRSSSVHRRMPLELLDPIFDAKAEQVTQDGWRLVISQHPVPHTQVQQLRRKALDLVFSELGSGDPYRSVPAAGTLEEALRRSRAISEQYTLEMLEELRDQVGQTSPDPLTALGIQHALYFLRSFGSVTAKALVHEVLEALPQTEVYDLARVLHSSWWSLVEDDRDGAAQEEAQAHWDGELTRVAAEVTQWRTEDLYHEIEALLEVGCAVFDQGAEHASPFISKLTESNTSFAEYVCARGTSASSRAIEIMLPSCLAVLLRKHPEEGRIQARDLIASRQAGMARAVAATLADSKVGPLIPPAVLAELCHGLADHSDPVVRQLVARAARNLASSDRSEAIKLVSTIPLHGSIVVAKELARAVTLFGWLNWSELTPNQSQRVLSQLVEVPHFEDFTIQQLLREIGVHDSADVLRLLIRRVEHWEGVQDRSAYTPIPFHWSVPMDRETHSSRIELLTEIHGWVAEAEYNTRSAAHRSFYGPDIFKLAAGPFDHDVQDLLIRWLHNGNDAEQRAACILLRAADKDLVWSAVPFVVESLRTAARLSDELFRTAAGSLQSSLHGEARIRTTGKPDSEDIEIRDRASAIIASLEPGSPEERFYTSLKDAAERSIVWVTETDLDRRPDGRNW